MDVIYQHVDAEIALSCAFTAVLTSNCGGDVSKYTADLSKYDGDFTNRSVMVYRQQG